VCTEQTAAGLRALAAPEAPGHGTAAARSLNGWRALLQVYRTNQSYGRWWEARKIWGTILNRVRDINTQVGSTCARACVACAHVCICVQLCMHALSPTQTH